MTPAPANMEEPPSTKDDNSSKPSTRKSNRLTKADKYNLRRSSLASRVESETKRNSPKTPKPKSRPPPLSKYRRKTANNRERERMKDMSEAFEQLRQAIQIDGKPDPKQTKVTTLKQAMDYITALRNLLNQPPGHYDTHSTSSSPCSDDSPHNDASFQPLDNPAPGTVFVLQVPVVNALPGQPVKTLPVPVVVNGIKNTVFDNSVPIVNNPIQIVNSPIPLVTNPLPLVTPLPAPEVTNISSHLTVTVPNEDGLNKMLPIPCSSPGLDDSSPISDISCPELDSSLSRSDNWSPGLVESPSGSTRDFMLPVCDTLNSDGESSQPSLGELSSSGDESSPGLELMSAFNMEEDLCLRFELEENLIA